MFAQALVRSFYLEAARLAADMDET
jgi:hypothetical protein